MDRPVVWPYGFKDDLDVLLSVGLNLVRFQLQECLHDIFQKDTGLASHVFSLRTSWNKISLNFGFSSNTFLVPIFWRGSALCLGLNEL